MSSNYSTSESRSVESKQDFITVSPFQPYSDLMQPKVIVQPNNISNQINARILPQLQQSLLEVNRENNLSANCFNVGHKNQTDHSHSGEIIFSAHALSGSENFQLDDQHFKDGEPLLYESNSVPNQGDFEKNSSYMRAQIDIQGSSSFTKSSASNFNVDSNDFESNLTLVNYNSSVINTYQQLTPVPQHSVQNVAKVTNESLLPDNLEIKKNVVSEQGTQSNTGSLDCDTFNSDEQVTAVIDILEETVVTTDSEHFCVEKIGTTVTPYTCGPCQIEFNSICKLHDHLENKHETGSYIYFCNTKAAFPRLEGVCKNIQTDLADFIDNDLAQFKDDEIDELHELADDLENYVDIDEGIHKSEDRPIDNCSAVERKNAGPGKRKKKCDDLTETFDLNFEQERKKSDNVTKTEEKSLGKGKKKCGDILKTVNAGSGKRKRKCIDIKETKDTGLRKGRKRLNNFTEMVDVGFGKGKMNCRAIRKNADAGYIKGKMKKGKKKGMTKHEPADKQGIVSVISMNSTSTRLKAFVKDKNKIIENEIETTGNKISRNCVRIRKNLKNSETLNQSEKVCEEDNDESVEQMQNQSDSSMFTEDSCVATLEAEEEVQSEKNVKSVNESVQLNLAKHEKILPSKLKLKETKKGKRVSRDLLNKNACCYSCSICATTYGSRVKLKYHMTKIHKISSKGSAECQKKCRWCGLTFPGSQSYIAHSRQCEKNENLICFICSRKFDSRLEVADHLITHRNIDELKCQLCEKKFANVVSLQRHLRYHNRPKNLQCEHCGKAFYFYNLLKKHMAYCNREPDIDCPHCDIKFKTPDALKHHMSVHSNERPFVCHICGYAVKKLMYLKRHIRSHTGERPYKCTECGMSFAAATGLNRHRKTHTNDKPCVCQFCGKSFTNNWNLKTHLRQHTGDTPYRCEQCGKAFKQNVLLKMHKKSHHPD